MNDPPPNLPPQASGPPAGPPPRQPARDPAYGPQRESKPVSFYLAIFLALLLFVSGGLNLLLLFVSALGSATGGFATMTEEDGMYEVVAIGGDSGAESRILRLPVEGAISEAGSPLIGAAGGTVSKVRRALKLAARDDSIGGVLLDINSPGGGVTDSDEIWRHIREFREETSKPIVALFGDVAASGGYYIAAACDRIIARPTSITGSIGVIMQSLNYEGTFKQVGLEEVTIKSTHTPFKDMMSPTRPMEPEEEAILVSIVEEMYERFLGVVDEGRPGLTAERVREIADGRIYSAKQALSVGLVDSIGTIEDAYAALRVLMEVEEARIVEYRRRPTLSEVLFGIRSRRPSLEESVANLMSSLSGPRLLYFWRGAR